MPRMKKTVLHLEVNEKEWTLKSNLSLDYPQITDKIAFKHDERIMRALMSDDKLFRLFYRLVEPVLRCKRRDARRAAKKQSLILITPYSLPGFYLFRIIFG